MYYRARANAHKDFVDSLVSYGVINSKRVEEVLRKVDRANYTPPGVDPYEDSPQTLGYGQTISAPHMHAMCLELVEDRIKPGAHVLDVGSGSGYLTAAFGLMVGDQGKVMGIDVVEPLVAFGKENIEKDQPELLKKGIIEVKVSDGWKGYPDYAPYDVIHVGAAAATMPEELVKQLAPGGIMVIPVGKEMQYLMKVEKDASGKAHESVITGVRYVPLVRKDA